MRKIPTLLLISFLGGCQHSPQVSEPTLVAPAEAVRMEGDTLEVKADREALLSLSNGGYARLAPGTVLHFRKAPNGLIDPLNLELLEGRVLLRSKGAFSLLGPDQISLQGGRGLFIALSQEGSLSFQALDGNAQRVFRREPSTLQDDFRNWYPLSQKSFQLSPLPLQTSTAVDWPWTLVPTDPDNLGPSKQVPGFSSP